MGQENQIKSEKTFRCFKCGAQNPLNARYCLNCGTLLLIGEEEENKKEKTPEKENEKSPKKKVGVVLLVLGVVLIFLSSLGFWVYTNQQKRLSQDYQEKVNEVWGEIYMKTLPLAQDIKTIKNIDEFSSLRSQVIDLKTTLTTQKFKVDREIIPSSRFKDSYEALKTFLSDFSDYLLKLEEVLADPLENGTQDDLLELKDKAETAQRSCQSFEEKSTFLGKILPKDVFDIEVLRSLIFKFQEDTKAKEQQEAIKKEQEAVQKLVEEFMDKLPSAYTQSDPYTAALQVAKKYWAASSLNIFEDQFRKYFNNSNVYWNGGRVLNVEKMGEGKFMVLCEETIKTMSSENLESTNIATHLTYFIVEKINNNYLITSHGER